MNRLSLLIDMVYHATSSTGLPHILQICFVMCKAFFCRAFQQNQQLYNCMCTTCCLWLARACEGLLMLDSCALCSAMLRCSCNHKRQASLEWHDNHALTLSAVLLMMVTDSQHNTSHFRIQHITCHFSSMSGIHGTVEEHATA